MFCMRNTKNFLLIALSPVCLFFFFFLCVCVCVCVCVCLLFFLFCFFFVFFFMLIFLNVLLTVAASGKFLPLPNM